MPLFRISALAIAAAFCGLAACSQAQSPADSAAAAEKNVSAVSEQMNDAASGAMPTGDDASELDRQLAELGMGGVTATSYAYADACDAPEAQLDSFKSAQRDMAAQMGTDAAAFDTAFDTALPLATRRVALDNVAMSASNRADTCDTMIQSVQ